MALHQYDNWSAVLKAAREHKYLSYKAPLDTRWHYVRVVRVYKNKKIRLDPERADADQFTADHRHLDRFVWLDEID